MKVNLISPDIYEIEDFISVDQQEKVLEYAKSLEDSEWFNEELKESFWYGKQKLQPSKEVFDDINQNVQNLFSNLQYVGDVALQRYLDKEPMQTHRDYWIKDIDHYIRYGIVIYYNDDYLGGEILYPELNISHKPKARSLVMHGGNILHGPSKVIGDNPRYFSTAFVRGSIDEPVFLNPCIFGSVEQHDGSEYPNNL